MRQDDRVPFVTALQRARVSAYPPGQFVEQESVMRADEIRELAVAADVGPGVSVLDLCCGVAGPGRFLTRELGCDYVGVDSSTGAIEIARTRAGGLPCRFEVGVVPPVPTGAYDVALLLETMLAFPDKGTLLLAVAGALVPGGRFAFTLEEGEPLSGSERAAMPDADTVWLSPLAEVLDLLESVGLDVTLVEDHSAAHLETAEALRAAYAADRDAIASGVGDRAVDELLAAHDLWCDWLRAGRVRKLAMVARKR